YSSFDNYNGLSDYCYGEMFDDRMRGERGGRGIGGSHGYSRQSEGNSGFHSGHFVHMRGLPFRATEGDKLADLVREHPNLYDQSRRDYRNSVKGHLAWKEIGAAMGKSEEEVKLLWKNLRDKFCKARKRLVRRQFPQQDDSDIPWEMQVPGLFSQMAWLTAHVKLRAEVGGGMGEPEEVASI
ncbi:hypothetical protein XENOCAPTIV_000234, partial [Xenoophorus captivus]